jgi:RNA polymerase sigma factor (sigma-70 family)
MAGSRGEVTVLLDELRSGNKNALELRYFDGLSVEETGEAMAISPRTVKRDWAMAKTWMKTQLDPGGSR